MVIAIIAVLAAILFPVFAKVREKGRQTACASNLRQIGIALSMYVQDFDEKLPDRRDLKTALGYRETPAGTAWTPTSVWPPSDPRAGWAVLVLAPYIRNTAIWNCPSVQGTTLGNAAQVQQAAGGTVTGYWLWRFDRPDNPIPLTDIWGKTEQQAVDDIFAANDATITPRLPTGVAEVELAVDPYFPNTIPTVDPALKGKSVHFGGRNRVFLDGHVKYLRDGRTE